LEYLSRPALRPLEKEDDLADASLVIGAQAVVLINAHATETDWFRPMWDHVLCFTDHRISFLRGDSGVATGSTHGSVFVYLGPNREVRTREGANRAPSVPFSVGQPRYRVKSSLCAPLPRTHGLGRVVSTTPRVYRGRRPHAREGAA
jgi:hypothetical protein